MITSLFSPSALRQNYQRILIIRSILLILLFIILAIAKIKNIYFSGMIAFFYILIAFTLITLFSLFRLRTAKILSENELFFQLLIDVTGLTLLLYQAGGSTNPVVSYYLIPIIISAAILPWRQTIVISLLCLLSYTLLLAYYQPLPSLSPNSNMQHEGNHVFNTFSLNPHVIGMWVNFVVSCFLITYFVVSMARALKKQEQELNQLKESDLRNEQILAVATLAAGTAHELGTPLSTIKLIASELLNNKTTLHREELTTILTEIDRCKTKLKELVSTASLTNTSDTITLKHFIDKLLNDWQLLRQEVSLVRKQSVQLPEVFIQPPQTLIQSIVNLLDNAADASPDKLEINISWDELTLLLTIRDFGSGIPENTMEELGQTLVSKKQEGLGLGLLLTHATITHFGGSVSLHNISKGKGTLTKISVPLSSFLARNINE
jgi:two-component system sensor histidine kinase RegB